VVRSSAASDVYKRQQQLQRPWKELNKPNKKI
jgi:hypothetical protein